MSVSQYEPIDEIESDRSNREEPRLPWQLSAIGGLVPVEESEGSGPDEQGGRKNRETAEGNHDAGEDGDEQDERNGFGRHGGG
jgi:hypothetical protein